MFTKSKIRKIWHCVPLNYGVGGSSGGGGRIGGGSFSSGGGDGSDSTAVSIIEHQWWWNVGGMGHRYFSNLDTRPVGLIGRG